MHHRRVVDPKLHTAPSQAGASLPGLPDDLVEDSVARLRVACLGWVGMWIIGLVMNHLVAPHLDLPQALVLGWPPIADLFAVVWIALSLTIYYRAPIAAAKHVSLVNLSLAYEIGLAISIGVVQQWNPMLATGRLSWICVLILIHPMIVPAPPRKILMVSLIAASMDPVGILIARARGIEIPGFGLTFWTYLPNYVCALLAVIPSQIIAGLTKHVSQARQMGSYQLAELIGSGGMGEVWRAQHRLLARPAAIKLIRGERFGGHTEASEQVAAQRFRREAEAAASLRSPHTIQIYDFGITRDHRFYIVMELLNGIDLESLVSRFGPQPAARVIHLLRQACESLAEAHAAGLVHRDIKPANLHLCRLGLQYDFVQVLAFGLVKHDQRTASKQTLLTAPDVTTGTPAYLPPEMASGEAVDARADVYALGCVAYFLLTGRLVFEGENALQIMIKHLQTRPVPPSERAGIAVPPSLERVILWCLEKDRDARPASASDLSDQLAACDVPPWTQDDARRWWSDHPAEAKAGERQPPGEESTFSPVIPAWSSEGKD
jgi:eukaryotic-like serine/threonine-protein kinase